jgi:hypothetical protein
VSLRENAQQILSAIVVLAFVVGFLFAVLGVILVRLHAQGTTELTAGGVTFKTANVGVAVILIAGALIVTVVRAAIDGVPGTFAGTPPPGVLRISQITGEPDYPAGSCLLDFRVDNAGGSDVLINQATFVALDVKQRNSKGAISFSQIYDLDISDLLRPGDRVSATGQFAWELRTGYTWRSNW